MGFHQMHRLSLLFSAFLFFLPLLSRATVWYVSPVGSDRSDGRSWSGALESIESALLRSSAGDVLWLAGGEYSPRPVYGGVESRTTFKVGHPLTIIGGFGGWESSPEERERIDADGNGLVEAWEYSHPTSITGVSGCTGTLMELSGKGGCSYLNGITFSGGDGRSGGALLLHVDTEIANCTFSGNRASDGGAVEIRGGRVFIEKSLFIGNDALCSGGAIHHAGGTLAVENSVFIGNGTPQSAAGGGGAVHSEAPLRIAFCSFYGNASAAPGSTLLAADSNTFLLNSLFHGTTGHSRTLLAESEEAVIRNCAVTAGGAAAFIHPGNIMLDGALSADELLPPQEHSPLINRGGIYDDIPEQDAAGNQRSLNDIPDIGAYECYGKGSFSATMILESRLHYGENAALRLYFAQEPPPYEIRFHSADESIAAVSTDGIVRGVNAGSTLITAQIIPADGSHWNVTSCELTVEVLPRPLLISADSQIWQMTEARPRLTWKLLQGALADGDSVCGELECAQQEFPSAESGITSVPITRGTLSISPASAADNYAVSFMEGTMECCGTEITIRLDDQNAVYNGQPVEAVFTTEPAGLAVNLAYQRKGDAAAAVSDSAPVYPGEYVVSAMPGDARCTGYATATLTIEKAPLQCIAEDKYRAAGEENPPLTFRFSGFIGDDSADDINELPVLQTSADAGSPVSAEGYPIRVTGGADDCYQLIGIDGVLHVTRKQPKLNDAEATVMTYGYPLERVWLMAYSTDPVTGEYVPGEFIWDNPSFIPDAGCWSCSWRFIPEDSENYGIAAGSSAVTIMPRPLSLRAADAAGIYGDSDPEFSWHISRGYPAAGDAVSAGIIRDAGRDIGGYQLSFNEVAISRNGRNVTANYELETQNGIFTILPRPITISALPASKSAGAQDPALTWEITGGTMAYDDTCSGALQRESGEARGEYQILQGTLNVGGNYALTFVPALFTITRGSLELAADQDGKPMLDCVEMTYGDALNGGEQLSGTVLDAAAGRIVPGTFRWKDEGKYLPRGEHLLEWEFLPNEGDEYSQLTGTISVTIAPAVLTAEIADVSKEYGSENPEFTITLDGFVLNEDASILPRMPEAICPADADSIPGIYDITLKDADYGNYELRWQPGRLTVDRAMPITAEAPGADALSYGQPLAASRLSGTFVARSGEMISGALLWKSPEVIPAAGKHNEEWLFLPDDTTCFMPVEGRAVIQVAPAVLTAQVISCSRQYLADNPEFKIEFRGFVNGEDEGVIDRMPTASTVADRTSPPGVYAVILQGGLAENYRMEYLDGTMTITESAVSPSAPVTASGITYGDAIGDSILQGSFAAADGTPVSGTLTWLNPGLRPESGTSTHEWRFLPAGDGFAPVNGGVEITVAPAVLTVTAISCSVVHNELMPLPEYRIEGFVNGEDDSVLLSTPAAVTSAFPGCDAGTYEIRISGGSARNYTFRYVSGEVTVMPAEVLIIPVSASKASGEADPPFFFSTVPAILPGGAVISGVLGREAGEAPGEYEFTMGTLDAGSNFILRLDDSARFTIGKLMPVLVELNTPVITYGQPYSYVIENTTVVYADPETGEALEGTIKFNLYGDTPEEIYPPELFATDAKFIPADQERYCNADFMVATGIELADLVFEFDNLEYYFGEAAPEVTCRLVGGVARDDVLEYGCRYEKGGYVPYWNVVSSPRYDRYGNLTMYTSSSKGIRKCLDRPVIITALPAYKVAGDEEPELKFTIYDVRRQEYITLDTTGTLIREAGETPGEYAIGTGTLQLPAHYEVAEFIGAAMEIRHNVIAVSEQEPESIRTLLKKSGIFASVTGSLQQALDEIRPNGEILLFPGEYGTGDNSPFLVGTSCSLINHEGTLGSAVLTSPMHMSDAVTSFTAEGIVFAPEQPESSALNLSRAVPEITVSNSAFMGNSGIFAGNYTSMSLAQCSFNTSGCGILLANEDNTSPAPHLENLTFHTPEPDCGTHTFISIGGDTFSGGIRTLQIAGVTLDGRSVTDQDDACLEFMQHCQCRMTIEIHR